MSESGTAVKLMAALAIVIFLANLMGVGAQSPFAALQATLNQGPQLPVFSDPFQTKEVLAVSMTALGNTNASSLFPFAATGCALASYWECLATSDADTSYVTISGARTFIFPVRTVEIPQFASDMIISRVETALQYRSSTVITNVTFGTLQTIAPPLVVSYGVRASDITLPIAETFTNFTHSHQPSARTPINTVRGLIVSPAQFGFDAIDWQTGLDVSYMRMDLWISADPECAAPPGAWFPFLDIAACQTGRAVETLITGLQFLANGFVFALLYIGGWAVWFGTVIGALLVGMFALATWFLDLDAPAEIQFFFAVITAMTVIFFFLMFARIVRG